MDKIAVLFVCMGNICRSPTAEAVFRQLVKEEGLSHRIHIDSAGTHAYHIGESPDKRSQKAALKRGLDLSKQRARKVIFADFSHFDYIIAMDRANYEDLKTLSRGASQQAKLKTMMSFTHHSAKDVPDPYYGEGNGFEVVLDLVEEASLGLLKDIQQAHL